MQFLVLGPLEVIEGDRAIPLPAAKHRALLAALLTRANQTVSPDALIDALWAGQPPASAGKTLQTYVSQLRRELEPTVPAGEWRTLRTADGGYRLHVEQAGLDARRFQRLADEGRRALHGAEPGNAAAWLRQGLALWRGPAYGELAGAPYVRAEAARLEELRLSAQEWRAEAELMLGAHAELVGELGELVDREPFRERLWGHLMLALYRSGRQADALRAYRRVRSNLAEQLGIDPGPELRRLEQQILRQDPALDRPSAHASPRTDLARLPAVFGATPRAELVGRSAEMDRLQQAWSRARMGTRQLVVLTGEPGIGKSRLAAELAPDVLADGGHVLVGYADEEPVAPYQPFIEALQQHEGLAGVAARLPENVRSKLALLLPAAVPDVTADGSRGGGELDRFHLLAAVSALLTALSRSSPLLLLLEDLHWADRATLATLLHLARSADNASMLVLVTARDGDAGVGRAWIDALDDMRRNRFAEVVSLQALDDDAVGGLVAGHVGHNPPPWLVTAIGRATDRNPFFVEELVRHLIETGAIDPAAGRWPAATMAKDLGVPEEIRQVLGRRLGRLSAQVRELLQMAAVLGREFEFTALGQLTGWEDGPVIEAVEEALGANVLTERGSSWTAAYAFRHALVREALYAAISQPRRQSLHVRAAAAIDTSGPPDPQRVAAVAVHLRMAGQLADPAKLISLSMHASELAAAVYAWDESVAHLRAALTALERTNAPLIERAGVAERLGVLVHQAGTRLEEGIGHLEWALAAYLSVGDVQAAARAHSRLGMHLTTYPATLNVAKGLAHYEAAESELARQPSKRRLGYLYIGMAMAAIFAVSTVRLEAASQRAADIAEELGDESLAGWARYHRAWSAFNRGLLSESLSHHEQMRDIASCLDEVNMGSWAAFGRAIFSGMYLSDPLTARSWCTRGLTLRRLEAFPRQRDGLLDHLGLAEGSRGDLTEARRIAASLDHGTVLERMLLYWSGEWEQSEAAWMAACDRDARGGDRLDFALNAYWLGRVRRLLGAHEEAEAVLAAGLDVATQGPQLPAELMLRAEMGLLAAERGRLEAGNAQLNRCQEILDAGENWQGSAGRVAMAAGALAAAEGRLGEAGKAFASAAETFRTHACCWDEAEAQCLRAKSLPAAASQRKLAVDIYRSMGAGQRWVKWAAMPTG